MKALEFKLSGKTAFFKNPQLNSYRYFTYSVIHKPALLGVIGSIVGLKGYSLQHHNQQVFPEYYDKLKSMKISIEIVNPLNIKKKEQVFNNSVGYASKEDRNNLVIREQWIESPEYLIRILIDTIPEDISLVEYLLNKKAVYLPYLGKNDHFADINDVKIIDIIEVERREGVKLKINGICPDYFELSTVFRFYKFKEDLPYALDETTNHYLSESFSQSNGERILKKQELKIDFILGESSDKIYCFF